MMTSSPFPEVAGTYREEERFIIGLMQHMPQTPAHMMYMDRVYYKAVGPILLEGTQL